MARPDEYAHVVMMSSGAGSAVAGKRVAERYGTDNPGVLNHEDEMRDWWLSDEAIDTAWEMAGAVSDRLVERGFAIRRDFTDLQARLVEAERLLRASREELDKHGHGDFHYGNTPRSPGVLAAIANIDAFPAGGEQ